MLLVENILDSLKKAIDTLSKTDIDEYDLKDSIIRFHHGCETLFKQLVMQKDEYLVYSDVERFFSYKVQLKINKMQSDEQVYHTIQFRDALNRCIVLYDKVVSEVELNYFDKLNKIRNSLTHYTMNLYENEITHIIALLLPHVLDFISYIEVNSIKIDKTKYKDDISYIKDKASALYKNDVLYRVTLLLDGLDAIDNGNFALVQAKYHKIKEQIYWVNAIDYSTKKFNKDIFKESLEEQLTNTLYPSSIKSQWRLWNDFDFVEMYMYEQLGVNDSNKFSVISENGKRNIQYVTLKYITTVASEYFDYVKGINSNIQLNKQEWYTSVLETIKESSIVGWYKGNRLLQKITNIIQVYESMWEDLEKTSERKIVNNIIKIKCDNNLLELRLKDFRNSMDKALKEFSWVQAEDFAAYPMGMYEDDIRLDVDEELKNYNGLKHEILMNCTINGVSVSDVKSYKCSEIVYAFDSGKEITQYIIEVDVVVLGDNYTYMEENECEPDTIKVCIGVIYHEFERIIGMEFLGQI